MGHLLSRPSVESRRLHLPRPLPRAPHPHLLPSPSIQHPHPSTPRLRSSQARALCDTPARRALPLRAAARVSAPFRCRRALPSPTVSASPRHCRLLTRRVPLFTNSSKLCEHAPASLSFCTRESRRPPDLVTTARFGLHGHSPTAVPDGGTARSPCSAGSSSS